MDSPSPRRLDFMLIVVPVLAGLFAAVAWRSVQHVNTQWDELNDHRAAQALLEHPLWGSGVDGSQARLPMYVTAAAYATAGASLPVARLVSILFASATILLTFYAGRFWFGQTTGLLAAALLAISPYFIGFSRMAMTESDAFCPLMVLLTMLAYYRYLCRRDTRSLVILSGALGLALAAKFYTFLLIPPLILVDLIQYHIDRTSERDGLDRSRRADRTVIVWALSAFLMVFLALAATQLRLVAVSILLWAASAVLTLIGIWHCTIGARGRQKTQADKRWSAIAGWFVIVPLAATVCLAAFPEHVIQPEVARAFLRRLIRQDHAEPMIPFIDPARLYAGIILFKMGLPIGVMTVAALVWAWIRSPAEPILRVLISTVVLYILLLTMLPLRQTFYPMSIYPLLILIVAAFVVRTALRFRDWVWLFSIWIVIVAASCLYLIWGDVRVYPDFGLYGYETVGDCWLGSETRGYRNLIQTTNDGTEDALGWCIEHVPPGKRVVSYLWDDHVVDAFIDKHPSSFELVRRHPEIDKKQGPDIGDSDFLIVGINNQVSYRDLPPAGEFEVQFIPEPVQTVWRGRREPYRMPVIQIYQRRTTD